MECETCGNNQADNWYNDVCYLYDNICPDRLRQNLDFQYENFHDTVYMQHLLFSAGAVLV